MSKFFNYLCKRKREQLFFVVSVIKGDVHVDYFKSFFDAVDYRSQIERDFSDLLDDIAIFEGLEVKKNG